MNEERQKVIDQILEATDQAVECAKTREFIRESLDSFLKKNPKQQPLASSSLLLGLDGRTMRGAAKTFWDDIYIKIVEFEKRI